MINDLLRKRFTAKWWEDRAVKDEDLDTILECAYSVPSKQTRFNYKIYVFTDSPEGKELKEWFYWENTACLDTIRGKQGTGLRRYNGQVLAPIYIVWIANNSDLDGRDDCIVSASIAMLAAEELGLQTGFCGCIGPDEIKEKLQIEGKAVISLGIGYAIPDDLEMRKVYKDGEEMGFDLSNSNPNFKKHHTRIRKPSFQNLIKIF
jgi:nitroreductase